MEGHVVSCNTASTRVRIYFEPTGTVKIQYRRGDKVLIAVVRERLEPVSVSSTSTPFAAAPYGKV